MFLKGLGRWVHDLEPSLSYKQQNSSVVSIHIEGLTTAYKGCVSGFLLSPHTHTN